MLRRATTAQEGQEAKTQPESGHTGGSANPAPAAVVPGLPFQGSG
jgi:hypothetical protein